ncbi:glycosyltransferase family 4 protein [Pontibacter populi]|uniref:Glycosyltransferase family 4 protein n=1 Tax=Pontibacter populi TaxID=890055 RepID=A0ABV1RVR4_9BACT
MKNILYLSFYFEPDLCAGSFRNTPLAKELAHQLNGKATIDLITTLPNRYSSFQAAAPEYEELGNLKVHRVKIPAHKSGFVDQIKSFKAFFSESKKLVKGKKYDLVFASSSRLFTAYLGYTIAKKQDIPLYLDIRDIFTDTLEDVLQNNAVRGLSLPVLRNIEKKVFSSAKHINLISEGFKGYFSKYNTPNYSSYPNGIDPEFLKLAPSVNTLKETKTIVYAGNIGEGQGLHKIIPQAAAKLGNSYKFIVIGDGGAKQKLVDAIAAEKAQNVELRNPMSRAELLKEYSEADFLFLHLNDYDAFKKVLPSKIFELAAYDKPVIAGVAGYANQFIDKFVSNNILFDPCDVESFVSQLNSYQYKTEQRDEFIEAFKRETINKKLSESIISYL